MPKFARFLLAAGFAFSALTLTTSHNGTVDFASASARGRDDGRGHDKHDRGMARPRHDKNDKDHGRHHDRGDKRHDG